MPGRQPRAVTILKKYSLYIFSFVYISQCDMLRMIIMSIFLLFISCAFGCSSSHSEVICNLWSLDNTEPSNTIQIPWSTTGSFASYFSPPGSRCELMLKGDYASNSHKINVHFAHIDRTSSVAFFTCNSTDHCQLAFDWSGVAWNGQHFSISDFKYTFTLQVQYLKIVLQVSASPSAPNTFALSWVSEQGCTKESNAVDDDIVAPYVQVRHRTLAHYFIILASCPHRWDAGRHRWIGCTE